jgi:hypothetical protein
VCSLLISGEYLGLSVVAEGKQTDRWFSNEILTSLLNSEMRKINVAPWALHCF